MGADSKIEWTDHTFNPWVGCTKVGPGCDHCYAEARMDTRLHVVQWGAGAPRKRTSAANWRQPVKWNAQAEREGRRFRVFCASLADVFDNEVPEQRRVDLFRLIEETQHLDWLLLTKRIGNAGRMMYMARGRGRPILPNVWIGASIVNQEEADRDIPKLLATPAAKRFLSMEPLLGPVDLRSLGVGDRLTLDALTGCHCASAGPGTVEECLASLPRLPGIVPPVDWVIVGGESGPKARPMHPDWARSLRDQCNAAGVPFHFKQWGEWAPAESVSDDDERKLAERWLRLDGTTPDPGVGVDFFDGDEVLYRVGKKTAGRLLDGRTWDEFPGRVEG